MQTALAALLATNVIDHATDSLNLVDPGQEQLWVGSVFALQLNLADAEHPLNDALDIGNIIDIDHIDAVDGS